MSHTHHPDRARDTTSENDAAPATNTHGSVDVRDCAQNRPRPVPVDIETLYGEGILTRRERRHLLRKRPNRIARVLGEEFRHTLNLLRTAVGATVELRGFIHPAPEPLVRRFNTVRYTIARERGERDYELILLAASLDDLRFAIPVLLPRSIIHAEQWPQAQFATLVGEVSDWRTYNRHDSGRFLIATELHLVGYENVFCTIDPAIDLSDFESMFRDRFIFGSQTLVNATLAYLFSSPIYEGRAGGNTLSPIGYSLGEYQCDLATVRKIFTEVHEVIPPWLQKRTRRASFDYGDPFAVTLRYGPPPLLYRPHTALPRAVEWITRRPSPPAHTAPSAERNITVQPFHLTKSVIFPPRTAKTGQFARSNRAQALSFSDLPLLLADGDLALEATETDILQYRSDIGQLLFRAKLSLDRTVLPIEMRERGSEVVLGWIEEDWPTLYELMLRDQLFPVGLIGGLGEHITRVAHAMSRATGTPPQDMMVKSEALIYELLTRFRENLEGFTRETLGALEERERIEGERVRRQEQIACESVLLKLDHRERYHDGWPYHAFETALKHRLATGGARVRRIFNWLRRHGHVKEVTPGLYRTVRVFDRHG